MLSFGAALEQARQGAMLTMAEFAGLAGFPPEQIRKWEAGEVPGADQLERCALVFGVSVEELLAGEAARANMTLLFKRNREPTDSAARAQLVDLETNLGPNRFCRSVGALARLEALMGQPVARLPTVRFPSNQGGNPGDQMASDARAALSLDPRAPIESLRALFSKLGVHVFVAATDEVDRRINGASTGSPVPAVMVARAANEPWVIRMTLAHELAHLLFHGGAFTLSPGLLTSQKGWMLEANFLTHEQQADAFAAAFLAPRFAVQDLLQLKKVAPESAAAIAEVGAHFGVGRRVAVNRIVDSMGLNPRARERLLAMSVNWKREFAADSFSDTQIGLQGGILRQRVLEAADQGLIDDLTARSMLSLPQGVTLDGKGEDAGARERRIARRIQSLLLAKQWPGIVKQLEEGAEGWTASLVDMRGGRLGRVRLDPDEQTLHRVES